MGCRSKRKLCQAGMSDVKKSNCALDFRFVYKLALTSIYGKKSFKTKKTYT